MLTGTSKFEVIQKSKKTFKHFYVNLQNQPKIAKLEFDLENQAIEILKLIPSQQGVKTLPNIQTSK
jgi:hypothetical protein